MEIKKSAYYIMDNNNKFVVEDFNDLFIYTSDIPNSDSKSYSKKSDAEVSVYNMIQQWSEGDIGAPNVLFPLRVVEVTTTYLIK